MHKINRYLYFAIIALIAISCDKIEDPWKNSLVIPQSLSAYTPEFGSQTSATRSRGLWEYQPESWDGAANIETRTYAVMDQANTGEYIQYWSEGDAISVFLTNANLKYQLSSFEDENKDGDLEEDYGHFQLVGNASDGMALTGDYYYSVYPYKENTSINYENGVITYNFPKNQHYNDDSYSDEENGMVAREPKNGDGVLYFQNFCSYLQLRLITSEDQPKKVRQIILIANNTNDKMSGDASIRFVESGIGLVPSVEMKMTASNQVILDCGTGIDLSSDTNNPTKFWFVLPGDFTFTEGFKITVTFDDNSYYEKSTSKEIHIQRSHIKPMATFTTIDEDGDDIVLNAPIRYKYNNTSTSQPYSLKDEFYGPDGTKLQIINQVYNEETQEWLVYLSGPLGKVGGNCFEVKTPNIEYIIIEEDTEAPIIIGDFAFFNCTADYIEINNDVETIGKSAIKGSTIKDIYIEGDVSVISEDAFTGSTRLRKFEATSVETIHKGAFQMCTSLTDVSVPGLKHLGASAFEDCTSLQSVTLDSIVTIEDAAFMGCYELTDVEISSYCTMIGEGAFCNTDMLETVICHAIKPPFIKTDNPDGSYVFSGASESLSIYIPDGSLSYYTDPNYFVNNESGYSDPIKSTVNWWYQEYPGNLTIMKN